MDDAADQEDPLKGLTSEEADARLQKYGRNEIPRRAVPWYRLLLRQFVGPFPCMIEAAAVLAAVAQKFDDFGIIVVMLLVNAGLGFYQEAKVSLRWCCGTLPVVRVNPPPPYHTSSPSAQPRTMHRRRNTAPPFS